MHPIVFVHFIIDPANLCAPSLLTSLTLSCTVGTPSLASCILVSTRTSTPLSYLGLGTLQAQGPPLVLGAHLSTDTYVSPRNSLPHVGPLCPPLHLMEFHAGPRTFVSHSGATSLTLDLASNLMTYVSASNLHVCNSGLMSNHQTLVSTSGTPNLVHHLGLQSAPGTLVHPGLLTTRTITFFHGLLYLIPCRAPAMPRPSICLLGNTGMRK